LLPVSGLYNRTTSLSAEMGSEPTVVFILKLSVYLRCVTRCLHIILPPNFHYPNVPKEIVVIECRPLRPFDDMFASLYCIAIAVATSTGIIVTPLYPTAEGNVLNPSP
jgi:hypothetical protein